MYSAHLECYFHVDHNEVEWNIKPDMDKSTRMDRNTGYLVYPHQCVFYYYLFPSQTLSYGMNHPIAFSYFLYKIPYPLTLRVVPQGATHYLMI